MAVIDFEIFYLENGLKVIVHEDHTLPKVVMNLIYRVGAKDEDPEKTGFAHLFEHLMFGGSKHIPEFDKPLQRAGGENNASTTNDVTNYYISLPSNQVETAFWLESDRMLELDFSQQSLDVQKKVVIEEFKQRYLNQPYGDAYLTLRELHFKVHPYRWPTIGKDFSHIQSANLEDVKEFFYGFYAPNNATLVLAGDIKLAEAKRLSEKWFGPIPRRQLKKHELPIEPRQTEPRQATVYRKVPYPAIYKMYHIPAKGSPEYFSADMLTEMLSAGRAGRLYQRMVQERKVVSSIRAFSWGAHHPGMISINAILTPGTSVETYESSLAEVLDEMQDVNDTELKRLKNSLETQFILSRNSLLNCARLLAVSDAVGDPELVNSALDKYLSLSVADMQAAAKKYLAESNCSTLYYLPENDSATA